MLGEIFFKGCENAFGSDQRYLLRAYYISDTAGLGVCADGDAPSSAMRHHPSAGQTEGLLTAENGHCTSSWRTPRAKGQLARVS
jgi:hypothetical protein